MTQALPTLMPGFDKEIAKLAQRVLINPRNIDYHTNVLATKVTPGAHSYLRALHSSPTGNMMLELMTPTTKTR